MRLALNSVSPLVVPVLVLAGWELAVRQGMLPASLAAAPTSIVANLWRLLTEGNLVSHLGYSVARIAAAVMIATSLGVATGVTLGMFPRIDRFVSPTLQFVAPVPVVVWMPFVILLFGVGEAYKVALAALAGFLIIHTNTYQAARGIGRRYIELADIFEVDWLPKVGRIVLPAASPGIFVGIRLTLALAWIVIFFVEFGSALRGAEGLGWFIADARALGRVEDEYAAVLLLGIAGFSSDWLAGKIQSYSLRWSDSVASLSAGLGE